MSLGTSNMIPDNYPSQNVAMAKEESVFERLVRQLSEEAKIATDLSSRLKTKLGGLKRFPEQVEKESYPEPQQLPPSDVSEYLTSIYFQMQRTNTELSNTINHLQSVI